MQLTPISVARVIPPRDNAFLKISASLPVLNERDILAVSSKIIAIGEGRTVPVGSVPKDALIRQEAQRYLPRTSMPGFSVMLTLTQGSLIAAAGIDESNANGHYVLWPADPYASARRLRNALRRRFGLKKLGVIITDSHTVPLRRGALGFAIGYAGVAPIRDYRGEQDLFGRTFKIEQANLVDALAAAAVVVMGEGDECTPVVRIEGAPQSLWTRAANGPRTSFVVPPKEDVYAPLLNVRWRRGKAQ